MKKKTAVLVFLSIALAVMLVLFYRIVQPFLKPVAFAAILSISVHPLHERLKKRVKGPGMSALISTFLIVFFFALPLTILLAVAGNEAMVVANRISANSASKGGFVPLLMSLVDRSIDWLSRYVDLSHFDLKGKLAAQLSSISVWALKAGTTVLGNFVGFIADTLITFITLFFFLRDGKSLMYAVKSVLPLHPEESERLLSAIENSVVANVYGILSVGAVQGALTGIGMKIAGMHSVVLLGMVAAVCSVIPMVGTALVWLPATVYLLLTGDIWQGVFLALWCSIIVGLSDNVVRPWVVADRVTMHPLLLLFSLIGGVSTFGFLGLFLGPIVVSVLGLLTKILTDTLQDKRSE